MGLPPRSVVVPASVQDPVQQKADSRDRDAAQQQTAQWMDTAMRPDIHGEPVQRKSAGEQRESAQALPAGGSGRPMPETVQAKMEGAFGTDFSAVRVHEGPRAEAMGALAYTQGSDIHFAPGQYDPGSQRGQELLGHELAHVVQQSQGRVAATAQAKGVALNDDPALEAEADRLGALAARGEAAGARVGSLRQGASAAAPVQRMKFARTQRGWLGSMLLNPIEQNDTENQLLVLENAVRKKLGGLGKKVKEGDSFYAAFKAFKDQFATIEGKTVQPDDYKKVKNELRALKKEITELNQDIDKQLATEQRHAALEAKLPGSLADLEKAEALVARMSSYELDEEQHKAFQSLKDKASKLRQLHDRIPAHEDKNWYTHASGFESSLQSDNQGGLAARMGTVEPYAQAYESQLSKLGEDIAQIEGQAQELVSQGNEAVMDIEARLDSVEADHRELEADKGAYPGGNDLENSLYDQVGQIRKQLEVADTSLDQLIQQRNAIKAHSTDKETSISALQARISMLEGFLAQCEQFYAEICDIQKQTKGITANNKNELAGYRHKRATTRGDNKKASKKAPVVDGGSSSPEVVEFNGAQWFPIPKGINLYGRIAASGGGIDGVMNLYEDALRYTGMIPADSLGRSGVKKKDRYEIKVRRTNLEAKHVPGDTRIYSTDILEDEGKTYITFGAVDNAH